MSWEDQVTLVVSSSSNNDAWNTYGWYIMRENVTQEAFAKLGKHVIILSGISICFHPR